MRQASENPKTLAPRGLSHDPPAMRPAPWNDVPKGPAPNARTRAETAGNPNDSDLRRGRTRRRIRVRRSHSVSSRRECARPFMGDRRFAILVDQLGLGVLDPGSHRSRRVVGGSPSQLSGRFRGRTARGTHRCLARADECAAPPDRRGALPRGRTRGRIRGARDIGTRAPPLQPGDRRHRAPARARRPEVSRGAAGGRGRVRAAAHAARSTRSQTCGRTALPDAG